MDAGGGGFGYFEFALAGVPLAVGTIAIAVFLGPRLLPDRRSDRLPPDLSRHARTLVEQFRLTDDTQQFRVREDSPLVGTPRRELDLSDRPGIALVTVKDRTGAARRDDIEAGDTVVLRGIAETVAETAGTLGWRGSGSSPAW